MFANTFPKRYSIYDRFYCMSFTVLGLCSPRKNDARLVVLRLRVFLAVSFQNFCTNFSNGSDQFAQKTSHKEAKI